jgi:hypothetical protein
MNYLLSAWFDAAEWVSAIKFRCIFFSAKLDVLKNLLGNVLLLLLEPYQIIRPGQNLIFTLPYTI